MSVTIISEPNLASTAFNPIIWIVDSTDKTTPGFRYVFEILDESNNPILEKRVIAPRPGDGYGEIDISKSLADLLSNAIDLGFPNLYDYNKFMLLYKVRIYESKIDSLSYSDTEYFNGPVSMQTKAKMNNSSSKFKPGDDVFINPTNPNLIPYFNGVQRIVNIDTNDNNSPVFNVPFMNTPVGSGGTITYADRRGVITTAYTSSVKQVFKSKVPYINWDKDYFTDNYKLSTLTYRKPITNIPDNFTVASNMSIYAPIYFDNMVVIRFTTSNGDSYYTDTPSVVYPNLNYINLNPQELITRTGGGQGFLQENKPKWYDVQIEDDSTGLALTKIYRIYLNYECGPDNVNILFEDGIGGFSPFSFNARKTTRNSVQKEEYIKPNTYNTDGEYSTIDGTFVTINSSGNLVYTLRTRAISNINLDYIPELLESKQVYCDVRNKWEKCKVITTNIDTNNSKRVKFFELQIEVQADTLTNSAIPNNISTTKITVSNSDDSYSQLTNSDLILPDINITWDNSNHIYPSVKNLDLNSVVTDKHNIDFIQNGNIVDTQPNSITQYNLPNLCSDEWVRPLDWLPEPTITEDQAAYILYHVEQGKENIFTIYCIVSGVSPLNTYTIDYGDGNIINYNNGVTSVHILDYDNISNSNMIGTTKQVYIKIYPTTAGRNITNIIYGNAPRQSTTTGKFRVTHQNAKEAFIKLPYSDWTFNNVYDYNNIERVKFIAIMPNKTNHSICFGNMAELRQVDIIPNQFASATNFSYMFANCSKFNQDLNDWTNIAPIVTNMFSNCYAFKPSNIQDWNFSVTTMDGFLQGPLIDIDTINLNTSGVTNFSNAMRSNLTSFRKVNDLSNFDFSSATMLVNFLYYIEYGQDTIHFNTTTALTNIQQVAYYCLGVKHIIFDECINVTNALNAFGACVSLETLVLPNLQVTTNATYTSMDATALNNLMTSLGTASGSAILNITNNPGSATCDPTIATAKGWTVLI
jgi:hypothetical protein